MLARRNPDYSSALLKAAELEELTRERHADYFVPQSFPENMEKYYNGSHTKIFTLKDPDEYDLLDNAQAS